LLLPKHSCHQPAVGSLMMIPARFVSQLFLFPLYRRSNHYFASVV
jgi:hypothetical protein